ncbi:MAG: hypothetical protein HFI26_15035 [Lachnospiraceae bacterium]|jgi:hypothetical protein|nr:hypothetical protein [Lachnospiraceae bacterium]
MIEQKKAGGLAAIALTVLILLAAVLGPEQMARYKDRSALNEITFEETENLNQGYRYILSSNEKLYLLSECLSRQVLPESELSAVTRAETGDADMGYEGLMGSYAFVTNRQGPSGKEIADEEIFSICNQELAALKELGILSESVKEVDPSSYSAVLYSAIDVLEPQNNMAVWRVSLSTSHQNADKANRLIDAYIDADSGKIYSFYARTDSLWSQMDPEEMMDAWGGYLGLTGREAYDSDNPLMETTPDFVKYRFPGMEERSTIVTIGFYEGINELFIKLT